MDGPGLRHRLQRRFHGTGEADARNQHVRFPDHRSRSAGSSSARYPIFWLPFAASGSKLNNEDIDSSAFGGALTLQAHFATIAAHIVSCRSIELPVPQLAESATPARAKHRLRAAMRHGVRQTAKSNIEHGCSSMFKSAAISPLILLSLVLCGWSLPAGVAQDDVAGVPPPIPPIPAAVGARMLGAGSPRESRARG